MSSAEQNHTVRRRSKLRGIFTVLTVGAVVGCGEKTPDPTGPTTPLDPDAFFSDSLPPWTAFSPPLPSAEASPTGPAQPTPPVTLDEVSVPREDGSIEMLTDQTYVCTETPYSVTDTPRRLVMYNPQTNILWAGGFIQGAGYKELGSLSGLTVDERAPIDVVIDGVLGVPGGVSRRVENPSLASVSDVVNELVGNATSDDLQTASTISFEMRTMHSEEAAGLSLGASGRYLGFSAATNYNSNIAESKTTVVAEFYEKMFTITVGAPSTPSGFFTDDLTGELIQIKYRNQMGPNNPPLYISDVVYGRTLMYSMTSTASESDIKSTIRAAFSNIAADVKVDYSDRQKAIVEEAEIKVVAIGGNSQNVLSLIESNNLSAYFQEAAPLTSAAPLSYTFSTLDGRIASVSETTEYTVRECEPMGTGRLSFLEPQTASAPIGGAFTSAAGDFDGDGYGDLVWRTLNDNDFFIGYGQPDGTFEIGAAISHPENPSVGWGSYDLHVADLDDDGSDDLVWAALATDTLSIYSAMSSGRMFSFSDETAMPGNWTAWDLIFGDFDDDGDTDLGLNHTHGGGNDWHFGEGDASGTFQIGAWHRAAGGPWTDYRRAITANIDNDAADEVLLNRLTTNNALWSLELDPVTKEFKTYGLSQRSGAWGLYSDPHAGDIDGVSGADVFNFVSAMASSGPQTGAYVWLSNADGQFTDATYHPFNGLVGSDLGWQADVGDLNEDGRADLIVNRFNGDENETLIAYGVPQGSPIAPLVLDTPAAVQEHLAPPAAGWNGYERRVLDVNGDGKDDVVWAAPTGTLSIYVGLAR